MTSRTISTTDDMWCAVGILAARKRVAKSELIRRALLYYMAATPEEQDAEWGCIPDDLLPEQSPPAVMRRPTPAKRRAS